jgi:hypothetical protein
VAPPTCPAIPVVPAEVDGNTDGPTWKVNSPLDGADSVAGCASALAGALAAGDRAMPLARVAG